ncbi:ROK family transcriptional regulator [Lapidilactobacillus bayanensis]|uniref:ROK family transcriptional regulator n=1 Tax=Lapidilactobacillus bayanensis TaxID=2485998 RepID=UPI000F7A5DC9|nr:ROK family transcriptional regulator [Lapidilactobacillus bayanensis]
MKKEMMRKVNELTILNEIYNNYGISRAGISKRVGLNKVTVSDILKKLIANNLVLEIGEGESSDVGGRKPVLLQINKEYSFTMSLDFAYDYIDYMTNYLDGSIIKYDRVNTEGMSPGERIKLIKEIINQNMITSTSAGLAGICVSIHGIVYHNEILYSPHVEMADIDIAQVLEDEYHVPILLENEANLAAVYERDFANDAEITDNIVCVSIHHGLGAGIIIDNKLYRGMNGEAGELGHTNIDGQATFEDYCTETALLRNVARVQNVDKINFKELRNLIVNQDEATAQVVAEFKQHLVLLIENIIMTFSPVSVILNSDLFVEVPELLDGFPRMVSTTTHQATPVKISSNSKNATLLGGCALITRTVLGLRRERMRFSEQNND